MRCPRAVGQRDDLDAYPRLNGMNMAQRRKVACCRFPPVFSTTSRCAARGATAPTLGPLARWPIQPWIAGHPATCAPRFPPLICNSSFHECFLGVRSPLSGVVHNVHPGGGAPASRGSSVA